MKHIQNFESFLNEANNSSKNGWGHKALSITSSGLSGVSEWISFIDAEQQEKDNDSTLPKEWYKALKTLKIKPEDAIIIFFDAVGDQNEVEYKANRLDLKYVIVSDDDEGGSGGIVFSKKQ